MIWALFNSVTWLLGFKKNTPKSAKQSSTTCCCWSPPYNHWLKAINMDVPEEKKEKRANKVQKKHHWNKKKSLSLAATAEFCMKKNPTNSDMRLLLTVRGNKYLEFAKVRMNENWSQGSQSASKRHRQKIPQFLLVLGCPLLSLALIEINWIQKSEIGNNKASQ